jgi:hypothetical protein
MTTPNLDVGTWLVTVMAEIIVDPLALVGVSVLLSLGTARGAVGGVNEGDVSTASNGNGLCISFTAVAVVTVAGTLTIDCDNTDDTQAATFYRSTSGASTTGWLAVQIAP